MMAVPGASVGWKLFIVLSGIIIASRTMSELYYSKSVIKVVYVLFHSLALTKAGPVSVSALVGENALFYCNGSGIAIQWVADGVYVTDTDPVIVDRGITASVAVSSGTVQSTLTVPATLVNNGTTVQCIVLSLLGSVTSNNATLTVLPGELLYKI